MNPNYKIKNVIMVVVDAFRPQNLSLFGYGKETDKNLKRIAREGVIFNNFFSSSNATAPSLMSIFTAKFPDNHGIIHQFPYTTEAEIEKMYQERSFWLPSFLQGQGYRTFAVDWIDMFFKDGFNYYKEREDWQGEMKTSAKFSPAEDTMNLVISKIENIKEPFFLFVHFWDTHFPFLTTEYKGVPKDINEILAEVKDDHQKEYFKRRVQVKGNELFSVQDMKEKYDAAIQGVDVQIGKLIDFLQKNNLWEETNVFILGDHGTNLTEHNIYFSSSSLFDETIHAPLVCHLPGIEQKIVKGFAQNVDLAPTILELIGRNTIDPSWRFDGKSMVDLIKNNKLIRDKVFFFDGLCQDVKGERTERKKQIFAKDAHCFLCQGNHHAFQEEYDLVKDPQEKENIYKNY